MNAETRVRRPVPAREQVDLAVEVFRMLSDATRVQVLWAMLDGEMSVNDLAEAVGKPAPGVSQHLAKLRMARLVSTRRQANQVFYRIESEHVRQLVADAIYQAEHTAGGIPEHHRADTTVREIRDPDVADGT
jgi:DNA-binding transcriptional ArsR family regulator